MVNAALIRRKIMRFRTALDRLATKSPMDLEVFLANDDAQDIVCRNLQVAIQVCIDIATHIVADEGWTPPKDLAGLVEALRAHGVIDDPTATSMRKAIGFRNILVHEYGEQAEQTTGNRRPATGNRSFPEMVRCPSPVACRLLSVRSLVHDEREQTPRT